MRTAIQSRRLLVRLNGAGVTREGRVLLHDVHWRPAPGQHWAVLGANGAGKTTFLRLVRGELAPDDPGSRTYILGGEKQDTPIGLRQRVGIVSAALQDFYAVDESGITALDTVLTGFFDTPLLYEEPTPAMRAAALEALALMGAEHLAPRLLRGLSQGQARRVLLARALAPAPDILILDEFLDGLDRRARNRALEFVERAAGRAMLLCAAHRAEDLPGGLTHALILDHGEVLASGSAPEVLPLYGADAAPADPGRWRFTSSRPREKVLLRMCDVEVRLDGAPVLSDISWEVRGGENWAVLGPNGAGKSTLLRLVLALESPAAVNGPPGTVERFGLGEEGVLAARARMALVSPALQATYAYDLTAEEVVWSGFRGSIGLWEEPDEDERARASEAMECLGLTALAGRRLRSLSYGQQRKVFLARALVAAPDLLLLDEPFSGLDAASRAEARSLLERLAEAGQRFLLVTHGPADMPRAVTHVLVLEEGRIVFSGTRAEYDARARETLD